VRLLGLHVPDQEASHDVRRGRASTYAKTNMQKAMAVADEFICHRLAIAVGLPVPADDLVVDEHDRPLFVSHHSEHQGCRSDAGTARRRRPARSTWG
jgi:hypothetical protein